MPPAQGVSRAIPALIYHCGLGLYEHSQVSLPMRPLSCHSDPQLPSSGPKPLLIKRLQEGVFRNPNMPTHRMVRTAVTVARHPRASLLFIYSYFRARFPTHPFTV